MADPKSPTRYTITSSLPSPQQYHDLRQNTGLTPPVLTDAPKALANSVYCVVARDTEHPTAQDPTGDIIGMGRLIGDGAVFMQVVDICVLPAYQRNGLGGKIMAMLIEWLDANAPNAYVSLIGHEGAARYVYPKYGFLPVAPSVGMYRCERVRRRREEVGGSG